MSREELLAILFEALGTPGGIAVATNNPTLLRARFYEIMRTESEDFSLLSLHISPSSPAGELWIVNRGQMNE